MTEGVDGSSGWRPSGALTLETVGALRDAAHASVRGETTIDLSAVTQADSAALALLIDLCRVARKRQATLRVTGMPEGLKSLAALYDVEDVIPASVTA